MKRCTRRHIMRKGYTRKSYRRSDGTLVHGTRIPKRCIRATSQKGTKSSIYQRRALSRLRRTHKTARRKFGKTPKCRSGYILREGYHRKSYGRHAYTRKSGTRVNRTHVGSVWVPPRCIRSTTGRPHGRQLFILEKGVLGKFGYRDIESKTQPQRHRALNRALAKLQPLSLYRKLNALYVLNKNREPQLAAKFKSDANWVKTTAAYAHR